MSNKLIEILNLNFSYDDKIILRNLNIFLKDNELLGLLGQNGSGKTTLLKLLTGSLKLQSGKILFNNIKIASIKKYVNSEFRSKLGVVFQECSLDEKISVVENLTLSGKIYGLRSKEISSYINQILEDFELIKEKNKKVKHLSGGTKRRVELARAILHNPKILFLDEPTAGLDEGWRKMFFKKLEKLKFLGLSSIMSTHRIDEAEKCDRLLIIHKGKILLNSTPSELRNKVFGDKLLLNINKNISNFDINSKIKKLNIHFFPIKFIKNNNTIVAILKDSHLFISKIINFLPNGYMEGLYILKPTLSDAYLRITGSKLENEKNENKY